MQLGNERLHIKDKFMLKMQIRMIIIRVFLRVRKFVMEHIEWQSLLRLGNQCFEERRWDQAEYFFSEAYDTLAFAYRNDPLSSDLLNAWLCACHNLSTLYESLGNLKLSLRFLMIPHDYLTEVTNSDCLNEDVKLIAFNGMNITLNPIMQFAQKHPMCEDCKSKLVQLQQLLEQENQPIH